MRDLDETNDGSDTERHPLEVLADEFAVALRAGANPSIEEYADRIPAMRDQAVVLLQSIVMFEQVSQQESSNRPNNKKTQGFVPPILTTLGDFKIIREIGRGGMGIIYEAEQLSLKRMVALKVLGRGIADSQKQLERFRRESEAIARLHHTNIVPVFGVGTEEGVHYFAMQLILGQPLSKPPELNFQEIARIGMQAADALAYAHEHGVLHRDIKPSNLLLDSKGELWVTDFGLAKLSDSGELTQDGDIMGTLKYMAPEQLDGRSDARSDIYGLGLTLYELATRQPAFDASKSLAERIRQHEIPAPRKINPAIPRNLETIILKATARDAKSRYATAAAMGEDLRRFIEDRPIAARRESIPERLGRWMRRNPAVAGSLAITIFVLAATSIVLGLGYWTTQNALRDAELAGKAAVRARDEAKQSQAQAEANLSIATAAFDTIFDIVSNRGVPQAMSLNVEQIAGTNEEEPNSEAAANEAAPIELPQVQSVLTSADVELLTSLLSFYREFAKQNSDDASLQSRIARAYQRSGQIQLRLGRSQEAIASYDEALKILTEQRAKQPVEPFGSLAIAQILNDRGLAILIETEFVPEAVEHHHSARSLLMSLPESVSKTPAIRFELARSFDLAGSVLARRGVTNVDMNVNESIARPPNRRGGPRNFAGGPDFGPDFGPGLSPGGSPMTGSRRPRSFNEGPNRQHGSRQGSERPEGPPPSPMPSEHPLPDSLLELLASLQTPMNDPRGLGFQFDRHRFGDSRINKPDQNASSNDLSRSDSNDLDLDKDHELRPRPPQLESNFAHGPGGPASFADIAAIVETEMNTAAKLLSELCSEHPENEEYQLASAQVNRHRMQLYLFVQRAADGEQAFEAARSSLSLLVERHPQNPQYLLELADTLSYASTKMKSISAETEERFLNQAITIGEQLCEAFPTVAEYSALLAATRDKFGSFARHQQRWQEAEKSFSFAAEGMESLRNRFPENRFYQLSAVLAMSNLAKLYLDKAHSLTTPDKLLACRDRLDQSIKSLTSNDKFRDPMAERFLASSRATLAQLNQQLDSK